MRRDARGVETFGGREEDEEPKQPGKVPGKKGSERPTPERKFAGAQGYVPFAEVGPEEAAEAFHGPITTPAAGYGPAPPVRLVGLERAGQPEEPPTTTKRGRPAGYAEYDATLTFRLRSATKRAMEAAAARRGAEVSDILRAMCEEAFQ